MRTTALFALLAPFALSACGMMPGAEAPAAPEVVVPTAMTADNITGDPEWIVFANLESAAEGDLVAQNDASGVCAFANGDGTFTEAPCA